MATPHITLHAPTITHHNGLARWSVVVDTSGTFAGGATWPASIWFEVPEQYTDMLTDLVDPAVVATTIHAIRYGARVEVDGPVADELAFNHPELQALYATQGHGDPVPAVFHDVRPVSPRGDAVLAGFSGGIDSFAMMEQFHYSPDVPESHRLTHLLFNNVGSHGPGGEELWRRRYERLVPTAERIGLPFIPVNSNLDALPDAGAGYVPLNTPANVAVAFLLSGGATGWVYSSSIEYRRIGTDTYNSAYLDPMALPLMSTSGMDLRVSRSDLRRIDKTRIVADVEDSWTSLDVCVEVEPSNAPNCSVCWKCRRTLGALDLLGAVDRYESQFDLDLWRRDRDKFLAQIAYTRAPALDAELRELMAEVGYTVPPADRPAGAIRALRAGPRVARAESAVRRGASRLRHRGTHTTR